MRDHCFPHEGLTNRRYTRLTNAFSKKLENHAHMCALTFMAYNFCWKHSALKTSPAVAAGVAGHVWRLEEVVLMIDEYFAAKSDPNPYVKKPGIQYDDDSELP